VGVWAPQLGRFVGVKLDAVLGGLWALEWAHSFGLCGRYGGRGTLLKQTGAAQESQESACLILSIATLIVSEISAFIR